MGKSLKISIPEPCHENWNTMTPADKGRFCAACQKCVVDFTAMPDKEVKAYLHQHQGERVCGKMYETQLFRLNRPEEHPAPWWLKTAAAVGLAAVVAPAVAQEAQQKQVQTEQQVFEKDGNSQSSKEVAEKLVQDSVAFTLKGKVVDKETKEEMPFANVVLKDKEGKQVGYAQTDIEGNYQLRFYTRPEEFHANDEFTLNVMTIGYPTKTMNLKLAEIKTDKPVNFKLEVNSESYFTGIIVIDYDPKYNKESSLTRESVWQKVGNRFERVK